MKQKQDDATFQRNRAAAPKLRQLTEKLTTLKAGQISLSCSVSNEGVYKWLKALEDMGLLGVFLDAMFETNCVAEEVEEFTNGRLKKEDVEEYL